MPQKRYFLQIRKSLKKKRNDAKSGQTLRSVGIGLAIAGVVGFGVSFAF